MPVIAVSYRHETVSCGIAHTVYRAKTKTKKIYERCGMTPTALKICFFSIQLPLSLYGATIVKIPAE